MDERLTQVSGQRLVHLLRSDAPRVARALVDKMQGRATVHSGVAGTTPFVEFVRPGIYSVVIRLDDWRRIFPLIRYGSGDFRPVVPSDGPPALVAAPQHQRLANPPPDNPGPGFTSFLAHFSWDEYTLIQRLLTMTNVAVEPKGVGAKPLNAPVDPVSFNPPTRLSDQSSWKSDVYERLVGMLQLLFPQDFPVS